jgi:hypothetical protein
MSNTFKVFEEFQGRTSGDSNGPMEPSARFLAF